MDTFLIMRIILIEIKDLWKNVNGPVMNLCWDSWFLDSLIHKTGQTHNAINNDPMRIEIALLFISHLHDLISLSQSQSQWSL